MAQGTSRKTHIDAPVTLVLAAASTVVFLLDTVFALTLSENIFSCHGGLSSPAFNFALPLDYVRLILHPLGFRTHTSFLLCLIVVLLLAPQVENRWGSAVFALMLLASDLVGGTFTAAFSPAALSGLSGVVFMTLILAATDKKTLPASHIAAFVAFACFEFFTPRSSQAVGFWQGRIPFFIELASGVAASLYGFFCSPQKRVAPKAAPKKATAPRKKKAAPVVDVTSEHYDAGETVLDGTPSIP